MLSVLIWAGLLAQFSAFAQSTQTFTSSTNWEVPPGYNLVTIDCWGAGGAGGSLSNTINRGPGGGGGAFSSLTTNITAGNFYAITIGAGGQPGLLNVNGGPTSFEDIVIAEGGLGVPTNTFTPGAGGSAVTGVGSIRYNGGNGGTTSGTNSGGGGGAGGWRGIGGNGSSTAGGLGNGINSGNGANPVTTQAPGNIGNNYGGGGSGARTTGGTVSINGGPGASGLVVINPTLMANPITNANPSATNPFTSGQIVASTVTSTGISRGPGITASAATDQFQASGFTNSATIDLNDYFQFTIAPTNGYQLNLLALRYSGFRTGTSPSIFQLRSSVDNYTASIGTIVNNTVNNAFQGAEISLNSAVFQGLGAPVTFRLYGFGAGTNGVFGINDFAFFGTTTVGPYIASFAPAAPCVTGSAQVTLTGLNFTGATEVKFNGVDATSFTVNSATEIVATVPTTATAGLIRVTTPQGTAFSQTPMAITNIPAQPGAFSLSSPVVCGGQNGIGYALPFTVIADRTAPTDVITMLGTTSSAPTGEEVFRAIDNSNSTKYLNFNPYTAPGNGNSGMEITLGYGPVIITALSVTSANDAPERDPRSYTISGSNDGVTWTPIANGALPAFTARFQRQVVSFSNFTAYSRYRIVFPTITFGGGANQNILQVAEIELLETTLSSPIPYNWSYSGTGATILGNGLSVAINYALNATSGTLSVSETNVCGTGPTRDLAISVNTQPAPTITPTLCQVNGKVTLTSSAAPTYLWSNGANTQAIEVDIAGNYTVTTSNGSCNANASYNLGNELVTNGNFSTLPPTGFTTLYVYAPDVAGQNELNGTQGEGKYSISTSANNVHPGLYGTGRTAGSGNIMVVNGSSSIPTVWSSTPITVQPNTTYYFSAWAMSVFNTDRAVLQFNINGNQVGTIAILPVGYTVTSGPYSWVKLLGSWESGANTTANLSIVNLNPAAMGNDFAIDDISFSTFSGLPLSATPSANAGGSPCVGSPLFLSATVLGGSSPYTYSWTGPNGFSSNLPNPQVTASAGALNAGTYNLTVTDALGCVVNSSVAVTLSTPPNAVAVTLSSGTICANQSVNVNLATSESNVFYQLRLLPGNTDVGGIVFGTGGAISLPTGSITTTSTFKVVGTRTVSGCVSDMANDVSVTVNPNPELTITNQALCSGTADLTDPAVTAGSTGGGTLSYWTNAGATIPVATPNSVGSGIYFIRSVIGATGCSDIEPVTVVISATPNASFNYSATTYCSNAANQIPTITGSAGVFSATPAGLVVLNSNTGELDILASTPGTYTVTNTITPAGACPPVVFNRTVTITARPVATFDYPSNDICQSISPSVPLPPVAPVFSNGGSAGTFASSSGNLSLNTTTGVITITTSLAGNYMVTNTRAATGGCPAVIDTTFVTINPYQFSGSITSGATVGTLCDGESTTLFANGTSYLSSLLQERFNGTVNGWTRTNTSVGGTVANAAWTLRGNNFNQSGVTFSSNDASQFYLSNSDVQNGTSTNTILRSVQLDTRGYTNLNLNFHHHYRHRGATAEAAVVEVSLNNIVWTTIATYNSTQGSNNAFSQVTLNLDSYIGLPTFYIRFRYSTTGRGWYWALDNPTISGQSSNYDFTWRSSPLGFTSDQASVIVTPTSTRSYIVNAMNTFGCSSDNAPVPVTWKPVPVLTNTNPPAICSGTLFSITPGSDQPASTITWTRPAVAGLTNSAINTPQAAAPNEVLNTNVGTTVDVDYVFVNSLDGCSSTTNITQVVNPRPIVSIANSVTVCNGTGATLNPSVSNSIGTLSYNWSPTGSLDNPLSATPVATPASASQIYALEVTDGNGCTSASVNTTVNNFGFGGVEGLWVGGTSNSWNNCFNWNDGKIPTATTDVLLNPGAINLCRVSGDEVCKSLSLISTSTVSNVRMEIDANASLTVTEDVFLSKTNLFSNVRILLNGNAILSARDITLAGSADGRRDAIIKVANPAARLNVNRNLNVGSGGFLDISDLSNVPQSATVVVKGNVGGTADAADYRVNTAIFSMEGTGAQTLHFPVGLLVHTLKLNNSGTSPVQLLEDTRVESNLDLTDGNLDLNGKTLTLGTSSVACQVNNASANSYVIGWTTAVNGTVNHFTPTRPFSYQFPLGDNTNFTPIEVTLNTATLAPGANISAQVIRQKHPNLTDPTPNFLNRYWDLTATGISGVIYDVEYSYAASDIAGSAAAILPLKYGVSGWIGCVEGVYPDNEGNGSINTVTRNLNWSGLTGFSDFTGAGNFTATGLNVWNGVGTWNTNGNWSLGTVPLATQPVRIASGTATISGSDVTVSDIEINAGATLDISNGRRINVKGNVQLAGKTTGLGFTELNGTSAQTITSLTGSSIQNIRLNNASGASISGPFDLTGTLKLQAGTLNVGTNFNMVSTATGTARIAPIEAGANINGDVNWQRYVPGPTGWRFIGTPILGQGQANWRDDFTININNLMIFNEGGTLNTPPQTNGWERTVTGGDIGRGYRAYLNLPLTYDNKGTIKQGLHNFGVTYTPTGFGGGGWNFFSNPYPCEINWDLFTRSPQIGGAIYIWNKTQYGSYVGGISSNGVTNVIAQGQAFFIKANAAGGSLSINELTKFETEQPHSFLRTGTNDNPVLKFFLENEGATESDEMAISFNNDATAGIDQNYDAMKLESGMSLSSLVGSEGLSISCLPLNSNGSTLIPLRVKVPQSGVYRLRMKHESGDVNYRLWLKDNYNNTFEPIVEGEAPAFTLTEDAMADRFEIVAQPLSIVTSNPGRNQESVMVYPNPASDQFTVSSSSDFSEVSLFDLQGRKVDSWTVKTGHRNQNIPLVNLAKGMYVVKVKMNSGLQLEQKLSIH